MHNAVTIARDLIALPSVNPMGSGLTGGFYSEKGVADYVEAFCQRLGLDVEIVGNDPDHPNILATVNLGLPETILLEAHMDTVSHEDMTIPPFDPVIADGLLFGRGSCDTKSSLAVYLDAIETVIRTGRRLRRNVIIAGVHDEEYSFGGSRELVERGLKATFAIAGEPTSLDIIYAHKGICRFFIETHGSAAHAALPWLGENAIYRMADVLAGIEHHALELQSHVHPALGPATINVGRIQGGNAVNIVPPYCTIEIDRRLLPGENFASASKMLSSALESTASAWTIQLPYMEVEGVYNDLDSLACRSLYEASHAAGLLPKFETAHYGTDASIFSKAGIPTIVFGPGSIALAHSRAEHVPISDIESASRIIVALLTAN